MSAFEEFREEVLGEVGDIARTFLRGNVEEARTVAEAFVDQSKAKLEKWTRLLSNGEITREEFAILVRSQKDLAEINALTQAGIGLEKAEQFRTMLTDVVITKTFDILL